MKKFLSVLSAFLLFSPALALWPRPQNLTTGSTPLRLAPQFSIQFSKNQNIPQDLHDAVQRSTQHLKDDKLQALVVDRGASSSQAVHSAKTLSSLTLTLNNASATVKSLSEDSMAGIGNQDESYSLQIPEGGNAVLTANTALGLFRGLTTFEQLWYDLDGETYTLQAPIQVQDFTKYVSHWSIILVYSVLY
jgi:hexosaminidase